MGVTLTVTGSRTIVCLRALLILANVLPCLTANALDPDLRISQYAHTAWRVRDGAFAGAPNAITQTADGYVWIGTFAGIVRFDGVRFVPFAPPAGQHLPNPAVISLLGATDGSLWIGTASGLAQWKNGQLFTFPETAGRVNSIYEDPDGTIWIARSRTEAGGVCKVALSVATCYAPKDGVPPNASVLIKDNLGYFLIGHSTGIVRWKPGSSTSYDLPGLRSNRDLAGISDLAVAPDGSVWAGLWNPGHGLGLEQLVNGSWKTFITPALDGRRWGINSLQFDRHNALWIATDANGIYRVHDGKVDRFAAADGLSSDSVEHAFEDSEGNVWLATAAGVDCFRYIPVVSFSVHEGLAAGASVGSIFSARDGTVWIGNHGELDFVRGNVVSSIGPKQGLRGDRVTSLFEDHASRLWVGLDNGLLIYEHGRFTPVRRPDGGPVGIVLAMTEDIDHNVWASVIRNPPGRPTKLICFRDGKFVKEISDQKLDIFSLAADPQSGLWLGLIQGGLARYRDDQVQVFPLKDPNARVPQVLVNSDGSVLAATNRGLVARQGDNQHTLDDNNGLPCNRIFAMVTDKHSDLWLYAQCGLIKIKSDELQRWREHPDLKVKFDLFDAFDGAQPYLPPFRPVATRSNDGRLWFVNDTVAQMIDPDGPLRNPIPPPVHIEDVIADQKTYSPQSRLHLPALTRDLEIDYTALSFVVPQKVHFQYKLEGYDRDWQDAGTRRQAFYNNLPPRSYTFRMKACNNSGLWNEAGASLDFNIAPAYYQTKWFLVLCIVTTMGLLYLLYQLRLRQATQRVRASVEARQAERERIARDLHDTLLQSVQGLILKVHAGVRQIDREDPAAARQTLERALDYADRVVSEGRDRVENLRASAGSLSDLPAAFQRVADEMPQYREATFKTVVEGIVRELHPMVLEECYAIGREALINALSHSEGLHIEVEINYDAREFGLRVRDDGRGIDPEVLEKGARDGHWGLPGMRERADKIGGQLEFWSRPGTGTEIGLTVPAAMAYWSLAKSKAAWFHRAPGVGG
jgi:signal transduction histidine kinase/ligand-binding sensor domain-containing protein